MAGDWTKCRLGDLVDVKHGFAFDGRFFRDEAEGPVLVTPGNFKIGGGFSTANVRYFVGQIPPGFELAPGDVIVTMTDLSKAGDTLGYAAVVPADGRRYLHNQRIGKVLLKPDAPASIAFIHWLMRTPHYRAEVLGSATGSTVRHTSPSRITAFEFELPPRDEQVAIADLLGAVDDKIELNRRMAETLEATARALFKSWFINFDPVHAKAAGHPTGLSDDLAALFPDSFDEGIPKGWNKGKLLEHARLISGGTPKTDVAEYWGGSVPWASAADVSQCRDTFLIRTERTITERGLTESATRLIPQLATVVVARGATTGRFCIFGREMAMNQTCYALTTVHHHPFWLNCLFESLVEALVQTGHGSVFDTITTRTLEAARIVVAEAIIIDHFESIVNPIFARILCGIEEAATLAVLRDTLLPKLISGELRITDVEKRIVAA